MKYIRTSNGIYPNEYPYQIDTRECLYKITCKIPFSVIDYGKVIKQADNIEELCDRFVMFCPNASSRKIRVYETMYSISLYSKRDKRWNGNMVDKVYGAIWTDKGLIYVAKMKGILPNGEIDWELL